MTAEQRRTIRATHTARAHAVPDPAISGAEPGTGIPFVLVTPGVKRDGQDPTYLPWLLENYRKNPVILPFHDAATFPIGAGEIDEVPFGRQVGLSAMAYFDIEDPVGALADSKYRRGFMRAISLGWDPLDKRGLPTRLTKGRPVANEVAEFSIVAIGGDPDALLDPGRAERQRITRYLRGIDTRERNVTFDFLEEAQDVLRRGAGGKSPREDYLQRAEVLEHLLRALNLCDGDSCRTTATHIVGEARSSDPDASADTATSDLRQARAAAGDTNDHEQDEPDTESHAEGEADTSGVPEDAEAQASAEGEAGMGGVPDDAEAEDDEPKRRQVAMAAMYRAVWVDRAEDADDDEREALYKSTLPEYRRLRLTRPPFMKARLVASMTDSQKRLLLPNGEADLMSGLNTRAGKKFSKSTLSQLEKLRDAAGDLRDGLDGMVAEAYEASETRSTRSAVPAHKRCSCGAADSEEDAGADEATQTEPDETRAAEDCSCSEGEGDCTCSDAGGEAGEADAALPAEMTRALDRLNQRFPGTSFIVVRGGEATPAGVQRAIESIDQTEFVDDSRSESYVSGQVDLTPEQRSRLVELLPQFIQEESENGTRVSLSRWKPWDGEDGPQAGDTAGYVGLSVALPADLLRELGLAVLEDATDDLPNGDTPVDETTDQPEDVVDLPEALSARIASLGVTA